MKREQDTSARVCCTVCAQWFTTPAYCLECSNWSICLECLREEGKKIEAELAKRGIFFRPVKETETVAS